MVIAWVGDQGRLGERNRAEWGGGLVEKGNGIRGADTHTHRAAKRAERHEGEKGRSTREALMDGFA